LWTAASPGAHRRLAASCWCMYVGSRGLAAQSTQVDSHFHPAAKGGGGGGSFI
jgi:hypothetical protein